MNRNKPIHGLTVLSLSLLALEIAGQRVANQLWHRPPDRRYDSGDASNFEMARNNKLEIDFRP